VAMKTHYSAFPRLFSLNIGGAMASWLVRLSPDRAVRFRARRRIFGQDTLLSQCLSPPRCMNGYRRIKCWEGHPAMDSSRMGVEILLVASCYRNRDYLRPDGLLGSYADSFTLSLNAVCKAWHKCIPVDSHSNNV